MADIVIHEDSEGDRIVVDLRDVGRPSVVIKSNYVEDEMGLHVTKEEAPQVAGRLASAITGKEMVVVRHDDLAWAVRRLRGALVPDADFGGLLAALGPEPCPAHIGSALYVECTLPKGHDGDHIPPATAWTVPS